MLAEMITPQNLSLVLVCLGIGCLFVPILKHVVWPSLLWLIDLAVAPAMRRNQYEIDIDTRVIRKSYPANIGHSLREICDFAADWQYGKRSKAHDQAVEDLKKTQLEVVELEERLDRANEAYQELNSEIQSVHDRIRKLEASPMELSNLARRIEELEAQVGDDVYPLPDEENE